MSNTIARRMLTTIEAAEYLSVAPQTLARQRVEGRGPPFLKLGGSVRYDVTDLERWIEGQRRRSTSEHPEVAA